MRRAVIIKIWLGAPFIAQAANIDLTLGRQLLLLGATMLTSRVDLMETTLLTGVWSPWPYRPASRWSGCFGN
ncbi:MAG: hypothetical protein LBK76_04360 [Verrucomicrobiales bacterium]|nr:hypothetical protein [Verrucomicrobiales bacterium]